MREFSLWCRCRDSYRDLLTAVDFLRVSEKAFGITGWGKEVGRAKEDWLAQKFEKTKAQILKDYPNVEDPLSTGYGIILTSEPKTVWAYVDLFRKDKWGCTGDSFSLTFSEKDGLPSIKYYLKVFKIVNPSAATLMEQSNGSDLAQDVRYRSVLRSGNPDRISMVHWLQYLDSGVINNMGGMKHVLKTPAYRVERFLDGVYIQLTKDYIEPENPEHLALQRAAMEHLGIWEYEPDPPSPPIGPPPKQNRKK